MKFAEYKKKKDFIAGKTIVGIDPAKQKHQAAVMNEYGIQIGKSFSFKVNYQDLRSYYHMVLALSGTGGTIPPVTM